MKKLLVFGLSILIILVVLFAGGVIGDVLDFFSEKNKLSEVASGFYYLYSDRYLVENSENADFIRLDYLKNPSTTYQVFGDTLSIQTPKEHYLIDKDGKVTVGTTPTEDKVGFKKVGDAYYIHLKELLALKGADIFGVSVTENQGLYVAVNSNFSYQMGTLKPETKVFSTMEEFDKHIAAKNSGKRSKASIRGIASEDVTGYYYQSTIDEKAYTFFISSLPELTGYIEEEAIEGRTKTEALSKMPSSDAPKKKFVLGWEAVYTKTVDTSEIGERRGLDIVSPTWMTLEDEGGALGNLADPEYIKWARERGYKIWPLISNHSDIELTHRFLASYEAQTSYIKALVDEAVRHGYEGYNLDFEHIYLSDRDAYSHFTNMFAFEMKKWGLTTSVDVNVMDGADNWSKCFDHEVLGSVCDYLVIMAYDEHHATSDKAGSNASFSWVEYNLKKILAVVSPHKVVLGVPFYTRVWETSAGGTKSEVLDIFHTKAYLESLPFEMSWDESAKQNKAVHKADGILTEVWIEDTDSLEHKAALVRDYGLAGIAAWRMGFETEETWDAINVKRGGADRQSE